MRAKLRLTEFTLSDGSTVSLPASGVVVVVGPNNAGKSRLLRDLESQLMDGMASTVVVTSVHADYEGTTDELIATFKEDRAIHHTPEGEQVALGAASFAEVHLARLWWESGSRSTMAPYFVTRLNTEDRLIASHATIGLNAFSNQPTHPLHHVYIDRKIEQVLDSISEQAFGHGLFIDTWSGGTTWALRIGEVNEPNSPRPTQEFVDDVRSKPLLQEQGDGVRSMLGLLLRFFTGHQNIALIDEPEAFLHPPQAQYLGRLLSDEAVESDSLIVLSTHSSAVVHGVLAGSAPTTVLRLTREGTVNRASILDNSKVAELWNDPLLRYSNLLEGLFSEGVVICESDVDCRFFAAVLDATVGDEDDHRAPDLHFTSCGGKHRMHVAVRALRAASVPVAVVADFDVLNDWGVLSRLFAAAGGSPFDIETHWRVLDAALRSEDRSPSVQGLRETLIAGLDDITDPIPTKQDLDRLKTILRIENGWDRVKRTGLSGVPSGQPYTACTAILDLLVEHRIHLVPVGEMEDLLPEVGGHGPAWLAEVLEQKLHTRSQADAARTLIRAAVSSILVG